MSGTLAVVTVYQGRAMTSAGFDQAEADDLAGAIAELGGWDSGPTVVDALPDLQERFPAGRQVMLGRRVHWRRGQPGIVAEAKPESFARWPESSLSPWFLGEGGAYVFVVLDDGYASWWPTSWLETR